MLTAWHPPITFWLTDNAYKICKNLCEQLSFDVCVCVGFDVWEPI